VWYPGELCFRSVPGTLGHSMVNDRFVKDFASELFGILRSILEAGDSREALGLLLGCYIYSFECLRRKYLT